MQYPVEEIQINSYIECLLKRGIAIQVVLKNSNFKVMQVGGCRHRAEGTHTHTP